MENYKIFDEKFHVLIKTKIRSVLLDNSENPITEIVSEEIPIQKTDSLGCSYCNVKFSDILQQREHYKLDWHRYNLKQSLSAKQPITEEDFDEKTAKDDVSSISGSDSESEEDNSESFARAQGKIFLQNGENTVFSIYACLVYGRKEEIDEVEMQKRLEGVCGTNKKWTMLMLGGGHFAGAVFEGDKAVLHKTFHTYTVRAGQGGTQSARDGKSGGSHPKSAGSSLRRYNEQALVQHVRSILDQWKAEIESSALIMYRASGPHNRSVLFGGSNPVLDKNDNRLRTIPFSTRRATFAELERVHSVLTQAKIYNSLEEAAKHFTRTKSPEKKLKNVNRAKSRERVERDLPGLLNDGSSSSEDDDDAVELISNLQDVSFEGLEEFGDSLTPEQRVKQQKIRKNKKSKKSKSKKLKEQESKRKNELIDVIARGKVDELEKIFNNYDETKKYEDYINEIVDDESNTLLHVAAMNEQCEIVDYLLKNNANPCLKNQKQLTAYTCTQSREIREFLKQFARENPDKYNYNKANIPTNVLTPEELAEKKKLQRKIKKEKEKIKKKENEVKKREQDEKDRFLKLSDREKRALAAERRILNQSGEVISRCFLCASDMSGKLPFEYLGNRFCTVDCLKAHRMQHPLVLS